MGGFLPDGEKEGEGSGGNGLHVAKIAADAIGSAVTEEIGAIDGVSPVGICDGNLLEEPAGIGSISVGHEDERLDGKEISGGGIDGEERLGEEAAMGALEVGLLILDALGQVILLLPGLVAPEVLGRSRSCRFRSSGTHRRHKRGGG